MFRSWEITVLPASVLCIDSNKIVGRRPSDDVPSMRRDVSNWFGCEGLKIKETNYCLAKRRELIGVPLAAPPRI